jgi:hypothetical protein
MSEQKQKFENPDQAELYINDVRSHYRQEHSSYVGRRNEEQQLIAEVTAEEARQVVDGTVIGAFALTQLALTGTFSPEANLDEYDDVEVAGHTWAEYRGEFERVLVGFAVITSRLSRDGYGVESYADLRANDRITVATTLFHDFMRHNNLRFGVETSGVPKVSTKRVYSPNFESSELERTIVDRDQATHDSIILRNMRKRGYTSGVAAHPALKLSPREYIALRKTYNEVNKDEFDFIISNARNARAEFEKKE